MSLLFKMQKTQITFSLALILKARIFQNFQDMQKGTWHHKTLEECEETGKIHMWTVWLLLCSRDFFSSPKTWKKDKSTSASKKWNFSLNCTAIGFISKNKE